MAHRQSRVGPGTVTDPRPQFLPSRNRERAVWHMGVTQKRVLERLLSSPVNDVQEKEMGSVSVRVLQGNTTNSILIDT